MYHMISKSIAYTNRGKDEHDVPAMTNIDLSCPPVRFGIHKLLEERCASNAISACFD